MAVFQLQYSILVLTICHIDASFLTSDFIRELSDETAQKRHVIVTSTSTTLEKMKHNSMFALFPYASYILAGPVVL